MQRKSNLFKAVVLIFTLLFAFPLLAVGNNRSENGPRYGGVFRIKSFSDNFIMQLDPASPDSFIFVSEQIFNALVKLDKNLNIVPSLAEYWEISHDGKKYTFHLRKNVKFHNGSELSSEDVKFSLERLLNKNTDSPYYQYFVSRVIGAREFRDGKAKVVEGFKALDKYTFEIHWTKPFVSALYLMSLHFCKILPRELVIEQGRKFFMKPSGTGPFKFDYWLRNTRLDIIGVRLKRNDNYYDGRPYLGAVEFSPHFTVNHFLNRQIESVPVVSEKLLKSNFQIFQDGPLNQMFLGMSCNIFPFDDPVVRRAISYGINKEKIAQAFYEVRYLRQLTNSYIPSRLQGFFPKEDKDSYNLDKAKQLLYDAGFLNEEKFPDVTLLLDSPRTAFKVKVFRELREQLEALGVKLKLHFYKSLEKVKEFERPYMILILKVMDIPDPEDIIKPLFFSKSIFNVFNYSNPSLDNFLHKTETEKSWTNRIKLFHQIENILFSDVPAIPLFSHQNKVAMQPYVRGVEVPPLGMYYLDTRKIWLDK